MAPHSGRPTLASNGALIMTHKLLFVDDNERLLEPMADYFRELGFHVDGASDITHAKALLSANRYSLVMTDWRFEGREEGIRFIEFLKDKYLGIPVVLLTACGSSEVEMSAIQHRVTLVHKPKPLPQLYSVIASVLRRNWPAFAQDVH
jgi:two-component system response regulator PilR (NtrC family)